MPGKHTVRSDHAWLAAAARLAQRACPHSRPNPGVGAFIVKDDKVVARGWTQPGGRPHAEAMALAAAGEAARGATLYSTLEPCAHCSVRGPACACSIAEAGLARCVYAVPDPDPRTAGKGAAILQQAGVETVQLECSAASASLAAYCTRCTLGRPQVTLKLALSMDGCIATAGHEESRWVTGPLSRAHVHVQRACHDAILVGGQTWRKDYPQLNVRLPGLTARSPRRIVLTRGAAPEGAEVLDSPQAITTLGDILTLYVEGGAQTAAAFLRSDMVDYLHVYQAPILLGDGVAAVGDIGLPSLAAAHGRWHRTDQRQLGADLFTAYARQPV